MRTMTICLHSSVEEHFLGKAEVISSILIVGFRFTRESLQHPRVLVPNSTAYKRCLCTANGRCDNTFTCYTLGACALAFASAFALARASVKTLVFASVITLERASMP